ncbi:two-component system KDP operon response regulator KdpE/two-component system response regulator MprA [Mucilaginibacter oryzae]|uniref:Two-component system KDP operon response regulator KdpE/two-component system response regulator MprA n=1 Tax=Mucilaginibacter oryzae TaxID=468058 RepID=A0A316HR07_9SPHI|nr:response regulator [Mucilaginibacter oryzae]PWK77312.1 two-component system KDP operon response regulator KdpE/two-component system response regulator MprA [Mucilaginibacter oryzae]
MSKKNKKIMIADDDPGIVDAVEMLLEFEGYDVVSTLDGSAALSDLKEQHPDLLLLDIWMSGEDGRDICKKIKLDDAVKDIPVIMVSASRDISKSAMEAGADDFLAKPFEMDELLNKIARYIEKQDVPDLEI